MTAQRERPLLGLCPIGKFVFSHEDAVRQKQALQGRLREWGVDFVDLEGVLEDGLVRDHAHVDPAVAHFSARQIDCLFVPHCNFGTEGAVGMIAHRLGLPTLLWGPRDEAPLPDGTRLRDTLCGLFASSKVLGKLGVPFTYIENCRLDDPPLAEGIDTFLRAANVAGLFRRGVRIGLIGQRIDFFWTTIINESELLDRFGIEVLPLDMVAFIDAVRNRVEQGSAGYATEAAALRRDWLIEGFDDDASPARPSPLRRSSRFGCEGREPASAGEGPLINVLAVRDQMLALAESHRLDGFALQTFMSLAEAMGSYVSLAVGMVSESRPCAVESDIHGAVSDLILRRATFGERPVWLGEFTVRHPTDENGVLMWHSGAPPSMCHPDSRVRLGRHWILPGPPAGMTHFRLKNGPLTVARFDGDRGDYRLAAGEGRSIDGPDTLNNYVWMGVDDWPRWERTLMQGPFIHHAALVYGHVADALVEACRYVPGLEPVRLGKVDG